MKGDNFWRDVRAKEAVLVPVERTSEALPGMITGSTFTGGLLFIITIVPGG